MSPRRLRRVRTGYAHRPPACGTYPRRRAACPQGPTYCTYGARVPASGVPYVPRTAAAQPPHVGWLSPPRYGVSTIAFAPFEDGLALTLSLTLSLSLILSLSLSLTLTLGERSHHATRGQPKKKTALWRRVGHQVCMCVYVCVCVRSGSPGMRVSVHVYVWGMATPQPTGTHIPPRTVCIYTENKSVHLHTPSTTNLQAYKCTNLKVYKSKILEIYSVYSCALFEARPTSIRLHLPSICLHPPSSPPSIQILHAAYI